MQYNKFLFTSCFFLSHFWNVVHSLINWLTHNRKIYYLKCEIVYSQQKSVKFFGLCDYIHNFMLSWFFLCIRDWSRKYNIAYAPLWEKSKHKKMQYMRDDTSFLLFNKIYQAIFVIIKNVIISSTFALLYDYIYLECMKYQDIYTTEHFFTFNCCSF